MEARELDIPDDAAGSTRPAVARPLSPDEHIRTDIAAIREEIGLLLPSIGVVSGALQRIIHTHTLVRSMEIFAKPLAAQLQRLVEGIEARRVAGAVPDEYIDPDDRAIDKLRAGYLEIRDQLRSLPQAWPGIDSLKTLHEACGQLCTQIIWHDLEAEPARSELFCSSTALLDALHAGATPPM